MRTRLRGMAFGVAVLAALWCLLPAGAAAVGDSDQSVAVTFNLCPGSGPAACAGLRVYVDSASNHYRPSEKYSYCTKDETSTGFAPKYNGEVLHVHMVAKGGFATSCQAPVASRNVWIVEAYKDGKLVSRGSFWFGQNTGLGTSFYPVCGKDAPLNPAFDNMICDTSNSNLTLSVPGSKPTYPDCPNTTQQYCAIQLHVDSTKPCLSPTDLELHLPLRLLPRQVRRDQELDHADRGDRQALLRRLRLGQLPEPEVVRLPDEPGAHPDRDRRGHRALGEQRSVPGEVRAALAARPRPLNYLASGSRSKNWSRNSPNSPKAHPTRFRTGCGPRSKTSPTPRKAPTGRRPAFLNFAPSRPAAS